MDAPSWYLSHGFLFSSFLGSRVSNCVFKSLLFMLDLLVSELVMFLIICVVDNVIV